MRIRFDRGTLVLDRVEPGLAPGILDGATWDSELAAWRMPAERLSELRVRLTDAGVRASDEIRTPPIEATWTLPPLRWYQQAALAAWRTAGARGVLALPTGSGKTVAALAAMAELSVATLVLVPTRVLLDQWASAIEAATTIVAATAIEGAAAIEAATTIEWAAAIEGSGPHRVGRLGDGDHRVAPITVSTYASAITWAPRIGDQFGLVIIDEAHHVGAWCPSEILEMLVAPARLGLTATPPIGGTALALDRHVGPVVYSITVDELAGDALAPFDVVTVPVDLTPVERATYRTHRGRFAASYGELQRRRPGASWQEFVEAAQRTASGRAALAAWRASRTVLAYPAGKRAALRELLARHRDDRVLVFTADNATAYAIARELLVVPITKDIRRAERAAVLERFRAGDAPVLVSSQVLDEGLDVPEAEVAIIVGGSGSERRHIQRVGRVLRPRTGKHARIYELAVDGSAEIGTVQRRRRGLSTDAMEATP